MEISKAPTLRLKALNKHTHTMYIIMDVKHDFDVNGPKTKHRLTEFLPNTGHQNNINKTVQTKADKYPYLSFFSPIDCCLNVALQLKKKGLTPKIRMLCFVI